MSKIERTWQMIASPALHARLRREQEQAGAGRGETVRRLVARALGDETLAEVDRGGGYRPKGN